MSAIEEPNRLVLPLKCVHVQTAELEGISAE